MLIKRVILGLSLVTVFAGTAVASTPRKESENCPDGFAFGAECVAENALTSCQTQADAAYKNCTVLCAHCSSLGNFNCFTTQAQCGQ